MGAPDLSIRLRSIYSPIMLALGDAPKPVLAAINGPAAGIDAALALACDLIVAAESSFELDDSLQRAQRVSADHAEGVAGFKEKRGPNFTGR